MPSNNNAAETVSAAIAAAIAGLQYLIKVQGDLAQGKELTDEERAALDAKIANIPNLSYWQVND